MPETTPPAPAGGRIRAEDVLLDRIKLAATTQLDRNLLHGVNVDVVLSDAVGFMSNRLAVMLTAELYAYRLGRRDVIVREEPRPLTWVDHLLDTLPVGSRRRRALAWLVGGDADYVTRTHRVEQVGWAAFPESTIRFPPELGRAVLFVRQRAAWDDDAPSWT